MGRDTESVSEAYEHEIDNDSADVKSVSHNFSSLSGSASNICWVNLQVN